NTVEYHLVKLLERFGNVKQFDFLFHKSGPLEGQPRGYCFVNFNTREVCARFKRGLYLYILYNIIFLFLQYVYYPPHTHPVFPVK
uniref:RNA binding motif protein 18 n=1 Tax=Gasterosteus aculeatus aculeatus TaxID=481459 RepID=A0AAQ4PD11_GASAC